MDQRPIVGDKIICELYPSDEDGCPSIWILSEVIMVLGDKFVVKDCKGGKFTLDMKDAGWKFERRKNGK